MRILLIVAFLAAVSLAYLWWTRRQGVVRAVDSHDRLSSAELGDKRGYHATFVQFSTPMCSVCPGTARLLRTVADEHPHVKHIEIDASERLDLARRFDIMRTPTTLVLDGDGLVRARMNGAPTPQQAREALSGVPASGTDYSI